MAEPASLTATSSAPPTELTPLNDRVAPSEYVSIAVHPDAVPKLRLVPTPNGVSPRDNLRRSISDYFVTRSCWKDNTTCKVVITAMVVLTILGVGIYFLTCWFRKCPPWSEDHPTTPPTPTPYPTPAPTHYPLPANATQVCESLATIASPWLQAWNQSAPAQNLYTNMTSLWDQFCGGARVINSTTISWGQTLLPELIGNIANQSVIIVTGNAFNPNNATANGGIPDRLYTLLSHSLTDFNNTDPTPWIGLQGFYWPAWLRLFSCCITQDTLRSGGFLAIKFLCDRWRNAQPVFANGNYTCLVANGADTLVMNFASSGNIWP